MRIKKIIQIFLVLLLMSGIGFGVYVNDYYHANETVHEILNANQETVEIIEKENQIVFLPAKPIAGLIFYPGGKVEYQAYAPLMNELAKQGVLCVLIEMPFHLAVLDGNAADEIQDEFDIENWYIGGHSLGGAIAANYIADHVKEYQGLILLAAYSTSDLSESNLKVLSLYGSEDKIMNQEKYEENRRNLPSNFNEMIIEGANHAGFGDYGHQEGDGEAIITNKEQIKLTSESILNIIRG